MFEKKRGRKKSQVKYIKTHITMSEDTAEKFGEYCDIYRLNRSGVIEQLVTKMLEKCPDGPNFDAGDVDLSNQIEKSAANQAPATPPKTPPAQTELQRVVSRPAFEDTGYKPPDERPVLKPLNEYASYQDLPDGVQLWNTLKPEDDEEGDLEPPSIY